jgi:hypothetical protein
MEAAISVFDEVLQLRPHGHERRVEALSDLGLSLFSFCRLKANHERRSRCFAVLREALKLHPADHPSRDRALHNLAEALQFLGFDQQSYDIESLSESIMLNRAALQLRPSGHSDRALSLNNLASGLLWHFRLSGDLYLLAEAVNMQREVLLLRPPGHPNREDTLLKLTAALRLSFEHQGGSETLAESISVARESLRLNPIGHPLRWMPLTHLGTALGLSYASTGFPEALSESISLLCEAAQIAPSAYPQHGGILTSLAHNLLVNFRRCHDRSILAEVITLHRKALRLLSGIARSVTLSELAEALIVSFDEHKDIQQLHEAVELHREVVELHREALESFPPSYRLRTESLQRLGRVLCRIECSSWTEALAFFNEALEICPAGSPLRAELISDTSRCFLNTGSPFFDPLQGVTLLSEAYSDNSCHVNRRLRLAVHDLSRVESAYDKATTSLDSSTRRDFIGRVLDLYAQVIGLLPRAANFGLDHDTRLQAVTGLDAIARNAAARALLLGRESQALEMLEEGRGVFWAQTLHLRTSEFDDVPQADRQELQRLLRLLQFSARRVESSDQNAAQQEYNLESRRQLNEEAEELIFKIRGYAGLDRFLLPPTFDNLVGVLPDGFVVIINASELGFHALLLQKNISLATSLELQSPSTGFDSATLKSHLPRDMGVSMREGNTRAMRKDSGRRGSFLDVLALLWTSVVRPVVLQLGLHVRRKLRADGSVLTSYISQKAVEHARPRVWWCVTGELGFLPIHAAGLYRATSPTCVADYATSSYIPTLSSLTKTRMCWKAIPRSRLAGLLVCEESPNGARARYLPEAVAEVRLVRECFASAEAQVLNTPSAHTSLSTLRTLLEEMPAQILHLACHGIHDSNPLRSALVLQDGNLTIQDIMGLQLPNAVLAVLSACQTAKGDRNAPDQAIHLAASMLFCGFRSVIGTMWWVVVNVN